MGEPRRLKASEVKVGDVVGLWNGRQTQNVEVIEDRGNVGMDGRRLFRVRVGTPGYDALEFEAPLAAMVAPATPPVKPQRRARRPNVGMHSA
jgi:hypothetical protein